MSRLGKKPLPIPDKVKVEFKNNALEVTGPLGKLIQPIDARLSVKVSKADILVETPSDDREHNMLHGLYRGLIKNTFSGVTQGFKKDLEIQGLGYKAAADGKNVTFQLGYSHPISFPVPDGIKIAIEKQTFVSVSGIDKALVGETAARIRALKKPEPYKGTGVRYVGEHLIKKVGKTAAGASGGGKK